VEWQCIGVLVKMSRLVKNPEPFTRSESHSCHTFTAKRVSGIKKENKKRFGKCYALEFLFTRAGPSAHCCCPGDAMPLPTHVVAKGTRWNESNCGLLARRRLKRHGPTADSGCHLGHLRRGCKCIAAACCCNRQFNYHPFIAKAYFSWSIAKGIMWRSSRSTE
jgi:hypothetical protein